MDQNNQKLIQYIQQEQAKGVSEPDIRKALQEVGWFPTQIDNAFSQINSPNTISDETPGLQAQQQTSQPQVIHQDNQIVSNPDMKESEVNKHSRFPKIGIAVLIILFLAGIAAAVYGYFFYYMAPERIVAQTVENMQHVKTYDYSGSVIMKISGNLFSPAEMGDGFEAFSLFTPREFSTSFFGSVDAEDQENLKSDSTFTFEMNSVELAEIQMLLLGDVYYVKLKKLNTFGILPVDDYLDQWLFINMQELSEEYDFDYEAEPQKEISIEDEQRIKDSITEHQPFEITEKLDNVEKNGVETFHFKYKVDKEQLKLFFQDITPILENYSESEQADIGEINNVLDGIEFYDGDIWIGKDDYYLYGVTGGVSTEIPDSDATLEIAIDLSLERFNESKNIVAPTEYKTFEELNQMLMQDFSEIYPATDSSTLEPGFYDEDYSEFLRALKSSKPAVSGMTDEK